MTKTFLIGQRVRCKLEDEVFVAKDTLGTVREIIGEDDIGVEWDKMLIRGHNLNGSITSRLGRYFHASHLEIVSEPWDWEE